MKDFYAQEILSVYLLKDNKNDDDDTCNIATKLKSEFMFDPMRAAIILISVFDYIIDLVPESIQNEFEEETLRIFKEALEIRHEHIFKLDKHYE